jgi:hypothetical protein
VYYLRKSPFNFDISGFDGESPGGIASTPFASPAFLDVGGAADPRIPAI